MIAAAPGFAVDPVEFAGQRVFVSGGTKGAGAAIVRRMAAAGATVATSARHAIENSAAQLFVKADLSTPEGSKAVAAAIRKETGGVDILIHCLEVRAHRAAALPRQGKSSGRKN